MNATKLVYFGTPPAAVLPLEALIDAGFEVALVVSQPDRRRGRRGTAVPSAVKEFAVSRGFPVVTPDRAGDIVPVIAETGADRGVVVGFGQILPGALLDTFENGLVNVHFSRLPRWRGAAPVERAILAGDTETAVSVMGVEVGLDTGPVYAEEVVTITQTETAGELQARLTEIGAGLLVRTLRDIEGIAPVAQAGEVTYAQKLEVDEFRLDLARPAEELVRLVRAGNPRPGAWLDADGTRVKIWRAHEEDGRFVPDEVQPSSKRAMPYPAWRAGLRDTDPFA